MFAINAAFGFAEVDSFRAVAAAAVVVVVASVIVASIVVVAIVASVVVVVSPTVSTEISAATLQSVWHEDIDGKLLL